MRCLIIFLFVLMTFKTYCQVTPAGFQLNIEDDFSSIASNQKDYDFISVVFDNKVEPKPERYFLIENDDGSYRYAYIYTGQRRAFGPWSMNKNKVWIGFFEKVKKGQVVSLFIRNKRTEKIMALFFRSKSKINHTRKIGLYNLKFREGNFFFDYCATSRKYAFPYSLNYKIPLNNGKQITDKAIDIDKFKIRIKKLNRILRKTTCASE